MSLFSERVCLNAASPLGRCTVRHTGLQFLKLRKHLLRPLPFEADLRLLCHPSRRQSLQGNFIEGTLRHSHTRVFSHSWLSGTFPRVPPSALGTLQQAKTGPSPRRQVFDQYPRAPCVYYFALTIANKDFTFHFWHCC